AFSMVDAPARTEAAGEAKNLPSAGIARAIDRIDYSDTDLRPTQADLAISGTREPPPVGLSAPLVAPPDARGKPAARRARHPATAPAKTPASHGPASRAPRPDRGRAGEAPAAAGIAS